MSYDFAALGVYAMLALVAVAALAIASDAAVSLARAVRRPATAPAPRTITVADFSDIPKDDFVNTYWIPGKLGPLDPK
ncbi:MAG: hypothetical protein ABI119_03295 [Gemmatimonadaceae bacterium]